ncbi:MAG: hypothetical protein KDD38_05495 [Bdellovibrionales bacterium]|nr:hypothetical protein [Bdellovibrionales bacterium]
MKTKMYKAGPNKYKAYLKAAGNGYEVGFMWGKKSLFMGNFVHKAEAQEWYSKMNQEYAHLSKKLWHDPKANVATAFYNKFISNSFYKHYYDYLDKCFGKYTKSYHREYTKDLRAYNKIKKNWQNKAPMSYSRKVA